MGLSLKRLKALGPIFCLVVSPSCLGDEAEEIPRRQCASASNAPVASQAAKEQIVHADYFDHISRSLMRASVTTLSRDEAKSILEPLLLSPVTAPEAVRVATLVDRRALLDYPPAMRRQIADAVIKAKEVNEVLALHAESPQAVLHARHTLGILEKVRTTLPDSLGEPALDAIVCKAEGGGDSDQLLALRIIEQAGLSTDGSERLVFEVLSKEENELLLESAIVCLGNPMYFGNAGKQRLVKILAGKDRAALKRNSLRRMAAFAIAGYGRVALADLVELAAQGGDEASRFCETAIFALVYSGVELDIIGLTESDNIRTRDMAYRIVDRKLQKTEAYWSRRETWSTAYELACIHYDHLEGYPDLVAILVACGPNTKNEAVRQINLATGLAKDAGLCRDVIISAATEFPEALEASENPGKVFDLLRSGLLGESTTDQTIKIAAIGADLGLGAEPLLADLKSCLAGLRETKDEPAAELRVAIRAAIRSIEAGIVANQAGAQDGERAQ